MPGPQKYVKQWPTTSYSTVTYFWAIWESGGTLLGVVEAPGNRYLDGPNAQHLSFNVSKLSPEDFQSLGQVR